MRNRFSPSNMHFLYFCRWILKWKRVMKTLLCYTLFGFVHINSGKHKIWGRRKCGRKRGRFRHWRTWCKCWWDNKVWRTFHWNFYWNLLSTDKQIDDFSIQIKDAQGHIVYTEAHLSLPAKGVYPILIGDWTNGLYTVTLCQDGKYAIYQFTK